MFIFDVPVAENKRVDMVLQSCMGLGLTHTLRILAKLGLNKKSKVNKLNFILKKRLDQRIIDIVKIFFKLRVEAQHKNYVQLRLKKFLKLQIYKVLRYKLYLPMRGQKSKYNGQTRKNLRPNRKRKPLAKKKK